MRCPQSCTEQLCTKIRSSERLEQASTCSFTICCGSRRFTESHYHKWGRRSSWLAEAENVSHGDSVWSKPREGKTLRARSTPQNAQPALREAKTWSLNSKDLGKLVHEHKLAQVWLHNRVWVGHSPCFIFIFSAKKLYNLSLLTC